MMHCKICGSDKVEHKFDLTGKLGIYACANCNVQFMDPQLSDAEITELYSEQYYKSWGISGSSENESSKQMKIATFLLRLNTIKTYIQKGKVLDIGCATGFFLEAAQSLGYEPYGIELSEYSSSIAKKKFGNENVFNGKLEDCTFKNELFNIISMFDLIEHVRVPRETLAHAGKLLDKDGIIIITTPDCKSTSNKLMGRKWTHYKKEHFFYFDLKSLQHIAKECNMTIIYHESSKKALNIDYLHTQLNVYKHWLFTPAINFMRFIVPKSLTRKNFHIGIGEITVVMKKN
jgi:2-polyprenyl-3-methyl-5-hydroxy-6-metoxy-1,4-benzoquinol methylase